MKKMIALLLALVMLCGAAQAQIGIVVNCESWVSLRAEPDKSSAKLAEVPLGGIVTHCEPMGKFMRCRYLDQEGYILAEYLAEDTPSAALNGAMAFYPDGRVYRLYSSSAAFYDANREDLTILCMTDAGEVVWRYLFSNPYVTELACTDAMLGSINDDPLVLAYTAEKGLVALEVDSGNVRWTLPTEELNLGGSLSHVWDIDGTTYIAGYYGPDPVAISKDGEVLWQSIDGESGFVWPYEMWINNGELCVRYAMGNEGMEGLAYYDLATGKLLRTEDVPWQG